ncbi:2-oxo acid dehydrogenase subunit E2 [Hyalangium versicolor]|uniref:2-oxo acid dehydrogenase subunit E2 n=1 Tax=Hyalangium versicolor TaxID=2861190 RepID=UPI001CCB8B71|nr:2-oxo acid dehydrogenase subunit E2 [Hyalangium versicolor]
MSIVELTVPRLGEGVLVVRVRRFFKSQGETVRQDDKLYEIETDKAGIEIESPHEGRLVEWLVDADAFVEVGAPLGRMEVVERPQDAPEPGSAFTLRPLSERQQRLNHHLRRSAEEAIPATMARELDWGRLRQGMRALVEKHPGLAFSEFQVLAYCLAQAARSHPRFRSTLADPRTLREFSHLNLGIAVELPEDGLTTAVLREADTLAFPDLVQASSEAIQRARSGELQITASTQVLVTYLGDLGVHQATPLLMTPAVGVLFIGAPFRRGDEQLANIALTFDHRVINGVGAARYLEDVAAQIERLAPDRAAVVRLSTAVPAQSPEVGTGFEARLRACLAPLLEVPAEQIPSDAPLGTLGVTSRGMIALQKRLEEEFGQAVPLVALWDHPNVHALAQYLGSHRAPEPTPAAVAEPSGKFQEALERVEQLSDEQIEALLAQRTGSPGRSEP